MIDAKFASLFLPLVYFRIDVGPSEFHARFKRILLRSENLTRLMKKVIRKSKAALDYVYVDSVVTGLYSQRRRYYVPASILLGSPTHANSMLRLRGWVPKSREPCVL
ncbi:hypothetical protein SBA7_610051 [Candidatus Sulfotelmatobacter sp. SbA7]|nr:hypothetical protein SBA7_610051 [Candidatus Sulfotelmatobacter sp. SbA7]